MRHMIKKISAVAATVLMTVTAMHGQTVTEVRGTVTDHGGEPLAGVTVIEEGTMNGVVTDVDGKYVIRVPSAAVLVYDYMGFRQVKESVSGRGVIDVSLEEDSKFIDEAVVVGYGTMRRGDLTGSVSSVSAENIENFRTGSVLEALGGQIAGVNITSNDGTPGSGFNVIVRGVGTVNGDSSPLYIVDGFEVDNIDYIANQDIQSIEVLKDASASAIYGARAANGVVLVTTKSGRESRATVSYSGSATYRVLSKRLDVLGPYDFVKLQVERNADRMTDSKVSLPSELFSGNPQLPADENNHFIPVSLQRPTTIFAYSMLTRCYTTEFESMKKLVKEGGIEGCCLKEKELLDPNDNMVKVVLEVEENGGFYSQLKAGAVQKAINESCDKRHTDVARRKESLLGTNQFPNFNEMAADKIETENCCGKSCGCSHEGEGNAVEALRGTRAASDFEALRLETERSGKRPRVFMLTIGNLAMRIARSQFSSNFFACAGYEIIDNLGFDTVQQGIDAAMEKKADIVVLCSSDDEYATLAPEAFKALDGRAEFVVAGNPACTEQLQAAGITQFIHVRSNVLETLKAFNAKLLK